jgi:integrase/recombinase XerD
MRARSEATTASYHAALKAFIQWASARGDPLGAPSLARYVEALHADGAGASKINRAFCSGKAALLQAAFRFGMSAREFALLKSVIDGIKRAKASTPEIRVVSTEERRRLFEAMPLRVRLLSRFLYATGCRVSEAVAVRVEHCRRDGLRVLVRLCGKGRKERTVRIPVRLAGEIEAGFGASRGGGKVYLFETQFGRAITAHDLRHSRATDLYARTQDLKGIAELLGHANIGTTARYYVRSVLSDEQLFEGEEL